MKITEKKVRDERSTEFKFEGGAWVKLDIDGEYGSWEFQEDEDDPETYSEGGLWFEEKKVVDYDGIFELPEEVKLAIRDMGYEIEED